MKGRHRFQKTPSSKCFSYTIKRKAGVSGAKAIGRLFTGSLFTHAKEKASKARAKHAGVRSGVWCVLGWWVRFGPHPYPVKSCVLRWAVNSLKAIPYDDHLVKRTRSLWLF